MSDRPTLQPAERIIVAIDVDELSQAQEIAEDLKDTGVTFKIGNQLGTYEGWAAAVEFADNYNVRLFADTKFKDIPTTVGKSSRAITRHQPYMFNVMADNTVEALRAAVEYRDMAVDEYALSRPLLLGVTVLTTIDNGECRSIYGDDVRTKVSQFATAAALAGFDGVVCSAGEAEMLRDNPRTEGLLLVTPGIRPRWAEPNDQKRIVTPSDAVKMGVDYMVIGRPITQPPPEIGSPRAAVEAIIKELEG